MTLTKLIELQAAATPGPWEAFTDSYAPTRVLNHKKTICHVIGDSAETDDTAAYIAAARNFDFAALDEKIKRYENDIGKLVIQRESLKDALINLMDAVADMPADPCECWPDEWDACDKALEGME